ncbi:MAG: hypothetical protein AAFW81_03685 [Pseudomonadota bacterium]
MHKATAGALIAALAATSACSSSRPDREANPAPCPNIVVLSDAARFIEFNGEERVEDVAFSGEFTRAEIACRYFADEPIDAEVELEMAFGKGPKADQDDKVFNYWVAVVRRDLEVITKKEFSTPVKFSEKRRVVVIEDEIDKIIIPRANEGMSGVNFEIIVGFSLTTEQAIFNRSGKSLKFPNLK